MIADACNEILKNAIENVLIDDGFKIQTPSSRSAVEDAKKLLHLFSLSESKDMICEFSEKLVSDVDISVRNKTSIFSISVTLTNLGFIKCVDQRQHINHTLEWTRYDL